MSTKREEKKKLYKSKIIEAAGIVFEKNGYQNTTIDQISKQAGVGMGTTYLYFKSKSELYRETIKGSLKLTNIEGLFDHVEKLPEPSQQVIHVSKSLMLTMFELDKMMIKEYLQSYFQGDVNESILIYHTILDVDNQFKGHLQTLLEQQKQQHKLADSFDSLLGADIVLTIIIEVFYKYLATDEVDNEVLIAELTSKLNFIIKPYERS